MATEFLSYMLSIGVVHVPLVCIQQKYCTFDSEHFCFNVKGISMHVHTCNYNDVQFLLTQLQYSTSLIKANKNSTRDHVVCIHIHVQWNFSIMDNPGVM